MSRIITIIVWSIVIIGVLGLLISGVSEDRTFFTSYKTAIEFYLFGFTSFLILKHIFFYRLKGNVDVIRLVKKSDFQTSLIWQGLVLALFYLVYNQFFYGNLSHFNSVMITILLFYYIVQLVLNSNPSIYIDEENFAYDDFFVERWSWKDIQRIELNNNTLRLITDERDFELDFNMVDEIDYIKLNEEVAHNILDGDFASEESSRTLVEIIQAYANRYNVRLVNSMDRII